MRLAAPQILTGWLPAAAYDKAAHDLVNDIVDRNVGTNRHTIVDHLLSQEIEPSPSDFTQRLG
jgi:hypothetical protein